jgi:hypothetical protein
MIYARSQSCLGPMRGHGVDIDSACQETGEWEEFTIP